MSQFPPAGVPPQGSYSIPPSPQKASGAAIGSLICGILLCIPFITGILAIILGFVGIKKTKDPRIGGKGMAIAGIVLGILDIVGWIPALLVSGGIMALIHGSAPQREIARSFITDLGKQDVAAAEAKASANLSHDTIQSLADQIKPWGALKDTTVFSVGIQKQTGHDRTALAGSGKFEQGDHPFSMILIKEGGQWKVNEVNFP